MQALRALLLLLLAGPQHALASPASLALPPQPLCTSCASWCAGECAFAGPEDAAGAPKSVAPALPPLFVSRGSSDNSLAAASTRLLQNVTLYRMTPSTTADLDNKNTGDPPGDLVFNMDERAIPMTCRHVQPGSNGGPE